MKHIDFYVRFAGGHIHILLARGDGPPRVLSGLWEKGMMKGGGYEKGGGISKAGTEAMHIHLIEILMGIEPTLRQKYHRR